MPKTGADKGEGGKLSETIEEESLLYRQQTEEETA